MDESDFLSTLRSRPADSLVRLAYADWLDDRGDPRADFVRLHHALTATAPDHVDRAAGEVELSRRRLGCDPAWLAVVEPERLTSAAGACDCFEQGPALNPSGRTPYRHAELQDTECDAWKRLLDRIEQAAADGREEFAPFDDWGPADRAQVLTLPPTIAKLKAVRTLSLYGSRLVRLPAEVGEMTSLEEFDPYTSYRLHWFPFELTRCRRLRESRVSTRAVYGNVKHRPPFPRLDADADAVPGRKEPVRVPLATGGPPTRPCSVCGQPFEDRRQYRVWVTLRVATDSLPLLVNACSAGCVASLPAPHANYVPTPHRGGVGVQQPPAGW